MEIIETGRCFEVSGRRVCGVFSCKLSNGKIIPTRRVTLDYVCEKCEHGLVETIDGVHCPNCGGVHIIHSDVLRKQKVDAVEVLRGLPIHLQKSVSTFTQEAEDDHAEDALWSMGTSIDTQPNTRNAKVEQLMRDKKLFKQEKRYGN